MAVATPIVDPPLQTPTAVAPTPKWWVEVVEDRPTLANHQVAWDALAVNAVETNVFFEPWMFLPAAQVFERNKPLCCLFVYRRGERPGDAPILCGFFPFERRRGLKRLPIRVLRLWEPRDVMYTPLVHRALTRETLRVLFDWIARAGRCSLVEMPMIHGEGPFHQALLDVLNERHMLSFVDELYTRALIRRAPSADAYFTSSLDRESLRNWRRLRRRLAELGKLEPRTLQPGDDVDRWIEQFLTLEASGWKGRAKTALNANDASAAMFRAAGRNGFAVGKLQMLGLFLNDQPIALKCNYLSGAGGYTYKIAYDESHARFSPGVLLELDNIEAMHSRPELAWLDSCAVSDHFLMNRLWKERRTIQHLLVATNGWTGNTVVGLLPMLRAMRRVIG